MADDDKDEGKKVKVYRPGVAADPDDRDMQRAGAVIAAADTQRQETYDPLVRRAQAGKKKSDKMKKLYDNPRSQTDDD